MIPSTLQPHAPLFAAQRNVLVVDDQLQNRNQVKTCLRDLGEVTGDTYQVTEANSAEKARALLVERAKSDPFEIVITDRRMETKDAGYEVIETAVQTIPQPSDGHGFR